MSHTPTLFAVAIPNKDFLMSQHSLVTQRDKSPTKASGMRLKLTWQIPESNVHWL